MQAFDLMVADRYAEDGVVSQRVVRERYNVPPPRADHERGERHRTTVAELRSEGRRREPRRRALAIRRRRRRSAGRRAARPAARRRRSGSPSPTTMIVEIALISGVTPNRIFE